MVGGGGCGLQDFSVSPRPLGFGFGAKGLGPGLDNFFSGVREIGGKFHLKNSEEHLIAIKEEGLAS